VASIHVKEVEQKALADQALADFAAKEGIVLDPVPSAAIGGGGVVSSTPLTEGPSKTMGPAAGAKESV
jgi:hypothetical protein